MVEARLMFGDAYKAYLKEAEKIIRQCGGTGRDAFRLFSKYQVHDAFRAGDPAATWVERAMRLEGEEDARNLPPFVR